MKERFSKESTLSLGIQLLNILEQIHNAGYIYNDLKLDNLMVMHQFTTDFLNSGNIFLDNEVAVIDFGFATRYLRRKSGEHTRNKLLSEFRGNFLYASTNQLNFETTSRRDDMISLFYLLVNLLHGGIAPCFV